MIRSVGQWWRGAGRASLPLLLIVCSLLGTRAPQAQAQIMAASWAADEIVPGQLVVRLKPSLAVRSQIGMQQSQLRQLLALREQITAEAVSTDTYVLQFSASARLQAIATQLGNNPDVAYVEPVYRRYAQADRRALRESGDPLVAQQWALSKIQAPAAWDFSLGNDSVIVASIDSGVNANHPDLAGRVLPGFNFVNDTPDASDDQVHGTFGAGVIAASGENGVGVAGVCWRCRILPVKVLNSEGVGSTSDAARGIRWAVDNGARILNLSFGGPRASNLEHEAIQYAVGKGALVIAAAGNEADEGNPLEFPAGFDEVTSVGATDINDARTFFSNYGPYLDLSAPGAEILSTGTEGDLYGYGVYSGTSFSAPYVSGVAALVWSINPRLSNTEVLKILGQTADDLGNPGPDDEYGFGRINAGKAAAAAQATVAPPPPPPPSDGQVQNFPETNHSLQGTFLKYWRENGGLPVFGFPISEQYVQTTAEGTFWVQDFERNRLEYHPEKQPPYNVLLGRLGDAVLKRQGRDWFTFPKGTPGDPNCLFFDASQHAVCGVFLKYWREHGLNDPKLDGYGRSLQLWGLPLSEATIETNSSGDTVLTQWFERGRFEDHGANGVLLGLLGNELARPVTPPPPPPPPPVSAQCEGIPAPVDATIRPSNCVKEGSVISMDIRGFQPDEEIGFWLTGPDGELLGTVQTVNIGPTGSAEGLEWDTTLMPEGVWFWVFQGTTSGHQSIIYFKVLPR